MIRSTRLAEKISRPYGHLPELRIKQDMFLIAGIAMIDSANDQAMTFTTHCDLVRGVGWEDAWKRVPNRDY